MAHSFPANLDITRLCSGSGRTSFICCGLLLVILPLTFAWSFGTRCTVDSRLRTLVWRLVWRLRALISRYWSWSTCRGYKEGRTDVFVVGLRHKILIFSWSSRTICGTRFWTSWWCSRLGFFHQSLDFAFFVLVACDHCCALRCFALPALGFRS
jgi:hypothetical protein